MKQVMLFIFFAVSILSSQVGNSQETDRTLGHTDYIYIAGIAKDKDTKDADFTFLNLKMIEEAENLTAKILNVDADLLCLQGISTTDTIYEIYNELKEMYGHFYLMSDSSFLLASKYPIYNFQYTSLSTNCNTAEPGFIDFILATEHRPLSHIYISQDPNLQLQSILEKMTYDFQEDMPFLLFSTSKNPQSLSNELLATYFYNPGGDFPLLLKTPASVLGPNYHMETSSIFSFGEQCAAHLTAIKNISLVCLAFSPENALLKSHRRNCDAIFIADNDRDTIDFRVGDERNYDTGQESIYGTFEYKGDRFSSSLEGRASIDKDGQRSSKVEARVTFKLGDD